jgi:release factor H-coupled RctB family protein
MAFFETKLYSNKIKIDKWSKKLDIESVLKEEEISEWLKKYELKSNDYDSSLGTIGGGNHFAELQEFCKIVDYELFEKYGLNEKNLYLLGILFYLFSSFW